MLPLDPRRYGLGSIEISLRFGDSNSFTHFALALVKLFHDESIGWRFALALLVKEASSRAKLKRSQRAEIGITGLRTLEINDANLPCRFKRLITLVQVRGVHEAGGSIFKCSSAPVDMAEQMNPGLLLFDRME
jgi:hypothetical protein